MSITLRCSIPPRSLVLISFFFFNDTATTEIYTLSLHDALPIYPPICGTGRYRSRAILRLLGQFGRCPNALGRTVREGADRKSTRLNSSHGYISYAVFCLKKKKMKNTLR